MSPEILAVVSILVLVLLMFLGVGIAPTLVIIGFLGSIFIIGFSRSLGILETTPYAVASNISFTVLPLFVLMGEFAFSAGLGAALFDAAAKWLYRLRGGLAIATAGGCALFAMVTGSSIATVATFTKLAVPQMIHHNYNKKLAYGVVASSGSLAVLIPPSGLMVLYCIFTEESLGSLMLAGFLPGALTVVIYTALILLMCRIRPQMAPTLDLRISWREKISSLRYIGPIVFVMVVMLGGIYLGVFTPTEAGAFGVVAVLIMVLVMRGMTPGKFKESLKNTVLTSTMIFFIIIGAMIYGKFVTLSGLTARLGAFLTDMQAPPVEVLIVILFIYLLLGTFLDTVAMVSITLPIFYPIMHALGLNGIWAGILIIKLCEVGMITPPFGINVFTLKATLGTGTKLEDVYAGIFPFLAADFVIIFFLIVFPQISLFLPSTINR
jgi:C4-dicarboxylate transporter, DctM subunit